MLKMRMEFESIDVYCERLTPEFWAEPVNAISNIGFVMVGIWFLYRARKSSAQPMVVFLSAMIVTIGVGSFFFHTYANTLTLFGDLVPIFIFTSAYLFHSLRQYLAWPPARTWTALAVVVGSMILTQTLVPSGFLNGSILYAPPLIALFSIAHALRKKRRPEWLLYHVAALVFAVSLALRTLDYAVCDGFPLGTHFLWHLLNAACLGLLMQTANLKRST